MVIVLPDQYVANVLPLDAHEELIAFLGRFPLDRGRTCLAHSASGKNPRTTPKTKAARRRLDLLRFTYGGEGGIRTHGTLRYA